MAVRASSRWAWAWNRDWAGGYRWAPASVGSSPPLPPAEASRSTCSFACTFPGSTSKVWEDHGSSSPAATPFADTPRSDSGCWRGTWSWGRRSGSSARIGHSSGSASGSGFRTSDDLDGQNIAAKPHFVRQRLAGRQVAEGPNVVGLKQAIPREADGGPVGGRDDVVALPRPAFEGVSTPLQPQIGRASCRERV